MGTNIDRDLEQDDEVLVDLTAIQEAGHVPEVGGLALIIIDHEDHIHDLEGKAVKDQDRNQNLGIVRNQNLENDRDQKSERGRKDVRDLKNGQSLKNN